MILPTYLLLLSLTSLATSFTIPPNAQEGVYQVSLNEAGEEVHVPLTQVNIVPAPLYQDFEERRLLRRYKLSVGYCDAAVQDLKDQINRAGGAVRVPDHAAWYSIKGSFVGGVVAFICNNDSGISVTAGGLGNSFGSITRRCGRYTAGTEQYGLYPGQGGGRVYTENIGYMQYRSGLNFCANAMSSNRGSC